MTSPDLPTGTVTMVFSDIEGSTMLLSRLGPAYADALDGQRQVLRTTWAANGGTEMGTEGDSFFVVFATAPAAVSAVTEAQRGLAVHPWPGGERVRVRIGVHTGNPTVHDGGYVGLDVHRAARIAGAAHGGQVVLSSATAELASGGLSDDLHLVDLGVHRLKDIPLPEHLFQLSGGGLSNHFPALRTLGAASSLPVPATPLVGRDGEVAELTALLKSPGVRLVSLTGPGGSGKTRLAIGVVRQLTDFFPDGVYFVPLAAVTTADVMWTSIAEVLDVPPEGRIPPGFFTHVANRSALLVLDNLEQLSGADDVVAELLEAAPRVVVVVTSRRPLNVSGELQHAVPPLELPAVGSVEEAQQSGAVQLFVQHARAVKASFSLAADNVADVVTICTRLDGLPLAIELAAARMKLLSPHAVLTRLDKALDIAASGSRGPRRQKTLRDTIRWSYELLTPAQQLFFRRLGVFSGGADLEAIAAVASENDDNDDPFDVVAVLVDTSLVTVAEAADGEPRIGMLETIRIYALDQLAASGELDEVRRRHADHFLSVAQRLRPLLSGPQYLETRSRFEADHDNLREALDWALTSTSTPAETTQTGLRLCAALDHFWFVSGYFNEGRRWEERAAQRAQGTTDSSELAGCLRLLAINLRMSGELLRAHECASASVDMWRRLGDSRGLASALVSLAATGADLGQPADLRRPKYEEALAIARACGDRVELRAILGGVAALLGAEHDYQQSLQLDTEALAIARELADPSAELYHEHNMACSLRQLGRLQEAKDLMSALIPRSLELNEPADLIVLAEDYAAILAELGDHQAAVRLLGAAETMRRRVGNLRYPMQDEELAGPIAATRDGLSTTEWEGAYQSGRGISVEDALLEVQPRA